MQKLIIKDKKIEKSLLKMLRLRFKPLTQRLRIPQIMWTAFQHDYMEPRRRALEMQRYSNIVRTTQSPKVQQEILKSSASPVGFEEETLNWLQRMFKSFEMTGQKFPIVNVNLKHR